MIKNLLDDDENQTLKPRNLPDAIEDENILEIPSEKTHAENSPPISPGATPAAAEPVYNFSFVEAPKPTDKPMFQTDSEPESTAETARKSGLAYAAAITLFAAIAFMLGIGWFVDLLFGTSPWGIVVGIVLGSIVGFLNFFRITSQILKNKD